VRASSYIGAGELALALACASVMVAACNGGDGSIGETCRRQSDCLDELQCFDHFCTQLCHSHIDCGDGYRCEPNGECALVTAAMGDRCFREIECGPGQTCALDTEDLDGDGTLAGTCQQQQPGLTTEEACSADTDCQTGICSLGHCTQMCGQIRDCPPPGLTCAFVPRVLAGSAPRFGSCIASSGVITNEFSLPAPGATIKVPVPSNANSFAVVTQIDDDEQLVGAWRVTGPGGAILYRASTSPDDFYDNPIRYQPARSISTLLIPNTPSVDLATAVYEVEVSSRFPSGEPGTAAPLVRVLYKVDTGATLDLHFYFLDLADHPCSASFDGGRLDAGSAGDSDHFRAYLNEIRDIFAAAGIHLGAVDYTDIADRKDLDALARDRAGELFTLATRRNGLSVFLVRSISPIGVQLVVNATPGPPQTPGSVASGVAISADTLCYQSWPELARLTAHALARQMGLYYNRDPRGFADSIPDSDESAANLMFFGEGGGVAISPGQAEVLSHYPGLQ